MKETLNVLSSLMLIGVYILYIRQTHKNDSTPNPATWTIWLIASIMNAISYFSVVRENKWEMVYIGTVTILMCITFFFSLFRGKFSKLEIEESIAIVLAIVIGILWKVTTTMDAIMANILMQGVFFVSFIPTGRKILDGTGKEKYPPWLLATVAYGVAIVSLAIDYDGNWIKFLYPTINGVIGNGSIMILSIIKKPQVA